MPDVPVLIDKAVVLRQIPLFADLNFFEKRILRDAVDLFEIKHGEMIYRQGDPPDALYGIVSGRVAVLTVTDGREEILEVLTRGKYFGFLSLLTGEPHSVSARALTDSLMVRIPKDRFHHILKSVPRLGIEMSRMLSRRLKRKDLHAKSVFESTIIAVYGDRLTVGAQRTYGLNLALGLRDQTQKKVILVESSSAPDGLSGTGKLVDHVDLFKHIVPHESGIDVLNIGPFGAQCDLAWIIAVVTMLVNDYHFCLVLPPREAGSEVFKLLLQADAVHMLQTSDPQEIKESVQQMMAAGVAQDVNFKKKMRLIIVEEPEVHGHGSKLNGVAPESVFYQPVYATLPHSDEAGVSIDGGTYAKVIRRIARQIGEVAVGLALGSGSSMGIAHIGVLKVLEREGVDIDIVCGSSIGALIGALWCSGYSATEIEKIILENRDKKYLFGWDDLAFPLRGLLRGKHVRHFLEKYLGEKTFRNVTRPFKVVVCDALSVKPVVFDSGRLIDAVLASVSLPGVFSPHKVGDHFYVDGGVLNPLPTNVLVEAGARKIIAVNTLPSAEDIERTYELERARRLNVSSRWPWLGRCRRFVRYRVDQFLRPNIFDVIVASVQAMEYSLSQVSSLTQADVLLHPDVTGVGWADFGNIADLIRRGEEEAQVHLSDIKELLNRPTDRS